MHGPTRHRRPGGLSRVRIVRQSLFMEMSATCSLCRWLLHWYHGWMCTFKKSKNGTRRVASLHQIKLEAACRHGVQQSRRNLLKGPFVAAKSPLGLARRRVPLKYDTRLYLSEGTANNVSPWSLLGCMNSPVPSQVQHEGWAQNTFYEHLRQIHQSEPRSLH